MPCALLCMNSERKESKCRPSAIVMKNIAPHLRGEHEAFFSRLIIDQARSKHRVAARKKNKIRALKPRPRKRKKQKKKKYGGGPAQISGPF